VSKNLSASLATLAAAIVVCGLVIGIDDASPPYMPHVLMLQIATQEGGGVYTTHYQLHATKESCNASASRLNKEKPMIWVEHQKYGYNLVYARCDLLPDPPRRDLLMKFNCMLSKRYIGLTTPDCEKTK
jgi:hypothetical protein